MFFKLQLPGYDSLSQTYTYTHPIAESTGGLPGHPSASGLSCPNTNTEEREGWGREPLLRTLSRGCCKVSFTGNPYLTEVKTRKDIHSIPTLLHPGWPRGLGLR